MQFNLKIQCNVETSQYNIEKSIINTEKNHRSVIEIFVVNTNKESLAKTFRVDLKV